MNIQRISAFSERAHGGNPAGVVLLDQAISDAEMARIASEVGYSETAFAVQQDNAKSEWRVRYFSPESEVPFCGHATIALGAALGESIGEGTFSLKLNEATITVTSSFTKDGIIATLSSPPTRSRTLEKAELSDVLSLFGFKSDDLDNRLAPAQIHGGSDHIVLALKSRETLASMQYDLERGREVMLGLGLVTIMLVFIEDNQTFVARNAFASGGVVEDPATGAAAAAFAGYLRDIDWPHAGKLTIRQGEDMGQPSRILVELSEVKGSPVSVSGLTREIGDA